MRSIILLLTLLLWVLPASSEDEVGILFSRNESHLTRAELIRKETKELRLTTFTFNLDDFGKETLGLLVDAAKRGVKVKLAVDGFEGSLPKNLAVLKALEESGIEVKLFNPAFRNALAINNRNHQKSLIGSDFMIVGDRNMTGDYFKRQSNNNYIGVDVLVKGSQVDAARSHFDEVFESSQMKKNAGLAVYDREIAQAKEDIQNWRDQAKHVQDVRTPLPEGNLKVEEIRYKADKSDGWWFKDRDSLHSQVVKMIDEAKTSLEFMNPYVLMTPETKKAVKNALDRGVKVKVHSNSAATTDSKLMAMAWDFQKKELMEMGIDVYELKPGQFLHAKTIVKDGSEVFVGSFNLDPRSQNINLENGVFVKDKKVADRVTEYNRKIRERLMVKVEREEWPKMTAKQKFIHCTKRSLRKAVSKAMFPLL
ncbi:phospholipase D-like domain-containing protein [Peredibacter starrii]|uniref:Phosphatidylserine/phosphatidylglycerophosphate/ cardiolipin synthase family protein n=1 Tax=Peredibacter starrii TaxID=28202 RepID=A0AAX4HRJ2_9BACT|nr:phosphatidylserine/phosphatidylglycerophosphate/cardiolipin synthase family protein [Peredibacter starrii]WPU65998.1 phosphatidylserine/phosphatidylglycerophosphate/cardiolipin synthase family protein [Peredibacter starrii]